MNKIKFAGERKGTDTSQDHTTTEELFENFLFLLPGFRGCGSPTDHSVRLPSAYKKFKL